jgi:streptomycin 6-kinase
MTEDVLERVKTLARDWDITVEKTTQTGTSIVLLGKRRDQPVVLKVLRKPGDEWHSGRVLKAFNGNGVVRVYEQTEGAVLLERIVPGSSLVELVLKDQDEQATGILAALIARMNSVESPDGCSMVEDWARGFDHYLQSDDVQIPRGLVREARDSYTQLCETQKHRRLLHGDLHHGNVLFDTHRGWLAIDPKGVVGETEYEIGAALRNPVERPDLFVSRVVIQRRIDRFRRDLSIDSGRLLRWGFAQAVLSVIWSWEDGHPNGGANSILRLAREMRQMLAERSGIE